MYLCIYHCQAYVQEDLYSTQMTCPQYIPKCSITIHTLRAYQHVTIKYIKRHDSHHKHQVICSQDWWYSLFRLSIHSFSPALRLQVHHLPPCGRCFDQHSHTLMMACWTTIHTHTLTHSLTHLESEHDQGLASTLTQVLGDVHLIVADGRY